jgi:hypothetical protein
MRYHLTNYEAKERGVDVADNNYVSKLLPPYGNS